MRTRASKADTSDIFGEFLQLPRLRVTAVLFDHIDGVHVTIYKV